MSKFYNDPVSYTAVTLLQTRHIRFNHCYETLKVKTLACSCSGVL